MLQDTNSVTHLSMKGLEKYIKDTTGLSVRIHPVNEKELDRLPLFIRKGFALAIGLLDDKELIFIFPELNESQGPKQLQMHVSKIEDILGLNAVLVFDEIDSYMRQQLSQMRAAFVVPGEQLYIPWMFISLDERKKRRLRNVEHFYPATQSILIFHLWKMPLNGMNLRETSRHFNYSRMTISRAMKELEAVGVCETHGAWEKKLEFKGAKREIWNKAKEFMKNPVSQRVEFMEIVDQKSLTVSGINALSMYSNLSGDIHPVFAVSKEGYKSIRKSNQASRFGETILEVWNYDPVLLEKNGRADPFSLYLTLKDNDDERVQIAIEEMMEAVL